MHCVGSGSEGGSLQVQEEEELQEEYRSQTGIYFKLCCSVLMADCMHIISIVIYMYIHISSNISVYDLISLCSLIIIIRKRVLNSYSLETIFHIRMF